MVLRLSTTDRLGKTLMYRDRLTHCRLWSFHEISYSSKNTEYHQSYSVIVFFPNWKSHCGKSQSLYGTHDTVKSILFFLVGF